MLYCTDSVYVYRNHRPRFRLAKHIAAGAGAFTFYQEKPACLYTKRMLFKALIIIISALLFGLLSCIIYFAGNDLLFLVLDEGCGLLLLTLSIYNSIKVNDLRGLLFTFLDMLHIGLWIVGVVAVAWKEEETAEAKATFADLLMQLR